jgi:predicted ATPase/DNA-binding SARP family transcriptional activator
VRVTEAPLEAYVLGAVQFRWQGEHITVDRPLERAMLTRLALARGASVRDDTLARDLWGDIEQTRPAQRLRVLASRARASLGPAAVALRRDRGGYALTAVPVDLARFEAAFEELRVATRTADPSGVQNAAAQALGCWRGAALDDLRAVPFASDEGERLDALRLDVEIDALAATLGQGDVPASVARLDALAQQHPLHERLCRLLAVALYRAGRQADALERLARLRMSLAEDLGVDPTPETVATELGILRQDADLLPVPAARPPRLRLPSPPTIFVGRDSERAALLDQLSRPGLITLSGSPGSGKTRLALEIARVAQAQDRDVVWVDLAPLREPDAVLPAVSAACASEPGSDDPIRRLARDLGAALLVIDNAEHLVDPVAVLLTALARHAGRFSVLVTSQRALLISGEELHHVGPLAPEAAAAVFCGRSGVTRDHRVDAVCAAVDYLPLGIELAAGLTRTLTLDQLVRRIDDRLRLLVGGSRDSGSRHTSLRAALDWSFVLLDPAAQAVLRRMAIFAGGCTLEAAEQVIADDDVAASDVAPILGDLAERSLVTVVTPDGGAPRFHLLESVREYATVRLTEAGEDDAVRQRHLDWCRAHVAAHDVQGEDEAGALDEVFAEWPNLLSALENAPGTDRAADGLRLAIALDDAWMFRGLQDQARRHYAALVDAPGAPAGDRARALSNFGFAIALVGETDLAANVLDRASREAETAGEPELQMRVLYHRGIALIEGGRPVQAAAPLAASEAIAQELGRGRSVAAIRDVRATAIMYTGDAAAAAALHYDSNSIDRAADHTHGLVRGLVNEAGSRVAAGDHDGALACVVEGLVYAEQLHDLVAEATLGQVRGNVAAARGDLPLAIEQFRAALTRLATDEISAKLCHLDLADALLRSGEPAEARQHVERALTAMRDRGIAWLLAQPTLASLAGLDGEVQLAAETLRAAEEEYAARGFGWAPALERMDRARDRLAARTYPAVPS